MSAGSADVTVGAVVATVADAFPPQWAEPWDRVGLLAGDPDAPAGPVLAALDPTLAMIERARAMGARTLLTHHPAYLETPVPVRGFGPPGVVHAALAAGIALVNAHTTLDRSPTGCDALPLAVGLTVLEPLERSAQPIELVAAYVPVDAAQVVTTAMAAAGAGRIGEYEGCSFESLGTGRFMPLPGAAPSVRSGSDELRIEMVAAPGRGAKVAEAARLAHPYEEPLITVTPATMARSAARLGRVCEPARPMTLEQLAAHTGAALRCTPRFWGDPATPAEVVATASGSGGSMIADALAVGAQVLLTGELRYHDALNALDAGLTVIEAGHDATEWPMVPVLAAAAASTPGLAPEDVVVAERPTLWRTA